MENIKKQIPVDALIILDGWGISKIKEGNAVALADTPFLDTIERDFPCSQLIACGSAVGLPDGTMGNSEVGHMNIGAGRRVLQDLVRINESILNKSFYANPELTQMMDNLKSEGQALHLMGLLSDGGVHSHFSHLISLIDMAADAGLKNINIHPILDGRDTPPDSGIGYIEKLQDYLKQKKTGRIASLCGRFYAMDRDTRWERVEKAFLLYTEGKGDEAIDPVQAVKASYSAGQTDEFIKPVCIKNNTKGSNLDTGKPQGTIQDGDGIIFFNFRADRAREITRAFTEKDFNQFNRKTSFNNLHFLTMTQYDESFDLPVVFPPLHLDNILGEIISNNGFSQLRIAETEKYAHVTYFFNGGDERVFPGEERELIPSPREVATYDEKPEMSAALVAETACEKIRSGRLRFMVLNFANMDMVGHTGKIDAAIKACETVDGCARQVVNAVWETGGTAMVTADHGNAEQMLDEKGNPHTAHTLNPVRFILAGEKFKQTKLQNGILGDIAPTVLKVMNLEKPKDMTGTPLF